MTDAGDDGISEWVAQALADQGLSGDGFLVDVIVADIRSRLEADTSLDALIGPGAPT